MLQTVTGICQSKEQLRNVEDDLRAAGIPGEKLFVDEQACQIKVMIPTDTQAGVIELIERHGATART